MLNVDNEPPDPPNLDLPYFFGYKTELFHFQNNRRNLDPYFKILDGSRSLGFLGRVQLILYQYYYIEVIQLLVVIVERGKTLSYTQINTVHFLPTGLRIVIMMHLRQFEILQAEISSCTSCCL